MGDIQTNWETASLSTMESEKVGNKTTVVSYITLPASVAYFDVSWQIFNARYAHRISGEIVNNVNGNITIGDYTNFNISNVTVTQDEVPENPGGTYPSGPPLNQLTINTIHFPTVALSLDVQQHNPRVALPELEQVAGMEARAELANLHVLLQQELTSLQHQKADTVIVVDHLGRSLHVPTIFCDSFQVR